MKMKKNVQNKNYRRGWRLLAVIGMLLCLPLLQLKAQEMRTITGLVVDQKGEILPGATVKAVQAPGENPDRYFDRSRWEV